MAHTGLAPKLISFTVNAGGNSFNDLVNQLRVAEVQRRLARPDAQRFTLLGIALGRVAGSQTQGQFTLKGQTRPVLVPVTVAPLGPDSLLLQGTLRINRTQFGINYNSSSFFPNLGSYAIHNEFQLAFQLKAGRR